jgi:glutathione S-transferase
MSEPTLVYLSFSPWSAKARWALAHHGVSYRKQHYVPMLGEPALRLRMRRLRGRITVPAWIDGERVLTDSLDIAREAERIGHGAPLFPAGADADVEAWNELGERMLAVGRARIVKQSRDHEDLRLELVPPPLRRVRPLAMGLASLGLRYFERKYGLHDARVDDEGLLRDGFDRLRAAIADRPHVLGGFTYADIAMALPVTFITPPAPPLLRLGDASRRRLGDPALARDYPDLVAWRDGLLARHHPWYQAGAEPRR